ncbi:alkaline phosphatase family protein [Flavihumibacter stibioxidans]|uniref:Nucleotide pyrophosphatase n=1 Tax=Flavihumibacter stibioxidans TaxID=1834163 RepID=A0ABR7MB23_9BACT|nr:alkaline phosphatase family protein [Flavihumibacter stibioxidans]MBC6491826.1 nucleotide pyrophosphatase [Flavihumibacter stibioxidans]
MKQLLTGICLSTLFAIPSFGQQEKIKKAVFIIVDGIPADLIERLNPPHLKRIAADGGYTRALLGGERGAYSETPTISAVGYNSLLTGTWVNKHNVWGNGIEAPNYNYWTIFRFLKQAAPDKKLAIFSTWLDNRTKLLGDGLAPTGNLKLDYHFDGMELDTIRYPHDKRSDYIHKIDEAVAEEARRVIKKDAPDLNWVYLQYTDDISHRFGDSPEFDKAVLLADKQIGKVYDAITYREKKFNEDWLIFITTDHGRDAYSGKHHGGQSAREKGIWIITNANNLNRYFKVANPGIVDILPSLMNHLGIDAPIHQKMEWDGVSLMGKISIANAGASIKNKQLKLMWDSYDTTGMVKVHIAETNQFKTGGKDDYKLIGEAKVTANKLVIPFDAQPGITYKIVLEGKYNMINRWLE